MFFVAVDAAAYSHVPFLRCETGLAYQPNNKDSDDPNKDMTQATKVDLDNPQSSRLI